MIPMRYASCTFCEAAYYFVPDVCPPLQLVKLYRWSHVFQTVQPSLLELDGLSTLTELSCIIAVIYIMYSLLSS